MSLEPEHTPRDSNAPKRLSPRDGVGLRACHRGERVGLFRPPADHTVDFLLYVDDRLFHDGGRIGPMTPHGKRAPRRNHVTLGAGPITRSTQTPRWSLPMWRVRSRCFTVKWLVTRQWSSGMPANATGAGHVGWSPNPRIVSRRPAVLSNSRKRGDHGVTFKSPKRMAGLLAALTRAASNANCSSRSFAFSGLPGASGSVPNSRTG